MTAKLSTAELRAMLAGITPGPWTFHMARKHFHVEATAPGFGAHVAELRYVGNADTGWTSEANARAIAQVPALLAEVIALRAILRQTLDQTTFYRRCNEQARNLPDEEGPLERQARAALEGTQ